MFTLQDKFNLRCSIHYNRDKKPRIYIFKESMDNLITLVKPYFIKEMLYKLLGGIINQSLTFFYSGVN